MPAAPKIVATVLCRLDSWSLPLALRAALEWVDEVVVGLHEPGGKVVDPCWNVIADLTADPSIAPRIDLCSMPDATWDEMEMRQRLLNRARELGATHIAIIDADEAVTADLLAPVTTWSDPSPEKLAQGCVGTAKTTPLIRKMVLSLQPGEAIDLPMVSPHHGASKIGVCLDHARTDGIFGRAGITLAFADAPNLAWKNADDGYCYHNRPPRGLKSREAVARPPLSGVFHLQYASLGRLGSKSVFYKITERLKFPGRDESSPAALNKKYDWTLDDDGESYEKIPDEHWKYPFGDGKDFVDLLEVPWQAHAVRVLVERHKGDGTLDGLALHEWAWQAITEIPVLPAYVGTF